MKSPPWVKEILVETQRKLDAGELESIPWEEAKIRIWARYHEMWKTREHGLAEMEKKRNEDA